MNNEIVQEIFVEDIIPNRFQPRLTFDEKALQELSDSIKVHGVIQPLVLRKVGNKYEIIAGERRYKASCMAGLKKVPAIVRDLSDDESAEVALIENVQRKNLTSIEEAQSYKTLLDRGYMTQDELAQKIGVAQSTIANKMRLLNLCDEVQDALLNEKISERHARSLLQLTNPDEQKKMLDRIIKERLTVKQLDNEIKKMNTSSDSEGEGGDTSMGPVGDTNNDVENKSLFGFNIQQSTDLEQKPVNFFTEEPAVPPAFNPFGSSQMTTELFEIPLNNSSQEVSTSNNTEEKIETFDMFGDILTKEDIEEKKKQENREKKNIGDQINRVRDSVRDIEDEGFKVELEEYDFEDVYQITIKIKKES